MDTVQMNGNDLIPKQETNVAAAQAALADLGMTANDLEIPRIMLMQGTSGMVGEDQAEVGDFISTSTNEVLGGLAKPIEIIPIGFYKTIRVMDMSSGQAKFKRLEAWTAAGEAMPWEGMEDGVLVKRFLCFNFYVLLKSELDADDAFPYVLTFKSSSLRAGRALNTHIVKLGALGRPMYAKAIQVMTKKEKNTKNNNYYAVMNIGKGELLTLGQQSKAENFSRMVKSMQIKEHEDGGDEPVAEAAPSVVLPKAGEATQF